MQFVQRSCKTIHAQSLFLRIVRFINPDSKVHGTNMGPTWVLSAPDGPHVGLMNLAIREVFWMRTTKFTQTLTWYSISQEICTRFFFAVLCCGYTLTDFPISIRLTSLALRQSNDCPSASKATLMNMDKYFMWIHYERLHNHNKAKHNKTVCIFLGIYCTGARPTKHISIEFEIWWKFITL